MAVLLYPVKIEDMSRPALTSFFLLNDKNEYVEGANYARELAKIYNRISEEEHGKRFRLFGDKGTTALSYEPKIDIISFHGSKYRVYPLNELQKVEFEGALTEELDKTEF